MRAAERRQKVVQRGSVRQVNEGDLGAPSVFVAVEEIVMANRQIEEMARRDTGWILVVVLGSRSWNLHQRRSILRRSAGGQRQRKSRELTSAEQSSLDLLVGAEASQVHRSSRIGCKRHRTGH